MIEQLFLIILSFHASMGMGKIQTLRAPSTSIFRSTHISRDTLFRKFKPYRSRQMQRVRSTPDASSAGVDPYEIEFYEVEIDKLPFKVARPQGIDDTILEAAETGGDLESYFWAFLWPASMALAQQFRSIPEIVKEKSVLEIGCGLGVAGVVAAMEGASKVKLVDANQNALSCALRTAAENGVLDGPTPKGKDIARITTAHIADWLDFESNRKILGEESSYDVIVVSDVLQEKGAMRLLAEELPKLIRPGGCVILAGGLLDAAELNFVGTLTSSGFGLEDVFKTSVEREWDVQMDDPNGNEINLIRLREGVTTDLSQKQGEVFEDADDLDEVNVDDLLKKKDKDVEI